MPKISDGATIDLKKLDYTQFASDSIRSFGRGNVFVHGPRGAGKTRLAATISECWDGENDPAKLTELSDVLWVKFERTPTTTLLAHNLWVKELDALALVRHQDMNPVRFVNKIGEILGPFLNPNIKTIVFDPLSEMARLVELHYMRPTITDTEVNTRSLWVALRNLHSDFRYNLRDAAGDRRIIYVSHSKPIADLPTGNSEAAKIQKKNEDIRDAAYGRGEVEPDVTGVNANGYEGECDVVGAMKRIRELTGDRHVFLPRGDHQFGGKHRLGKLLPLEMKPNLQLIFSILQARLQEAAKERSE